MGCHPMTRRGAASLCRLLVWFDIVVMVVRFGKSADRFSAGDGNR